MREVYQNEEEANVVDDTLEAMVREGARRMLAAALEEEVSGFLGRDRYERGEEFRGYQERLSPQQGTDRGSLSGGGEGAEGIGRAC